jgi:hypothetical protein
MGKKKEKAAPPRKSILDSLKFMQISKPNQPTRHSRQK